MEEFSRGAALLVEPGSVPALADALETTLAQGRDTPRRELGIQVAQERTWDRSVAQHIHAYQVALAGSQ
jgi:hypothetical protein